MNCIINLSRLLFLLTVSSAVFSQTAWNWTELDSMLMEISNNAVTHGTAGGETYVFSFGGIDSTKIWSGITQRSFRYHVTSDSWEEISPLPSSLANIAAAASTVQNKIYIIGGYNVSSGSSEISSNEVIIYDPETNAYLPSGSAIPIPIDDQVQCVWRDSLIYVITGWSNTTNVPDVQIYDPAMDNWTIGTSVPNSGDWKVFGGSGQIIGDTIYYFGGANTGWNFPATNKLRKGVIDPDDPTQINWTLEEDAPNNGYRQACLSYGESIYWVGGAATSYNYNGIAYNGLGGVSPLTQIMRYDAGNEIWYNGDGAPYGVMDLRGAAQISPTSWIICGGMQEGQAVSRQTFRLDFDPIIGGLNEEQEVDYKIVDRKIICEQPINSAAIYSLDGKKIYEVDSSLEIPESIKGLVIVSIVIDGNRYQRKANL